MTPERWQRQKAVFSQVQSANPEERVRLLDLLCGEDRVFRREMDELLAGLAAKDPFLDNGAAPPQWKPGDVVANRFELLRLAGEGGMGQVWVARDRGFKDEEVVAIKTIREQIASEAAAIERFKRELQLARKVAHPNVCKLYELFVDEGDGPARVFLTMEYLEGETLTARLKREGRIQPAEATDWMRQLCAGLEAAHAAEVIHRDLKPGNIMLAKSRSGMERVVITDFGLARASAAASNAAALSVTGAMVGTPDYMAPEQIRGDTATPATDVYALGLIFYEMLKGERPFAGKNTLDSWMRRIREGPPKLSGVVEDVPANFDPVITKCLEYEPMERYPTARSLWEGLQGGRRWPGWNRRWTKALAGCLLAVAGIGAWRMVDRFGGPGREATLWYQDARRDLAEGAALRATNQLRRALAVSPKFAAAHAALAEAQLELDQNSMARESIMRASSMAGSGFWLSTADRTHIEGVSRLLLRDCPAAVGAFRTHVEVTAAEIRPYAMTSLARAYERCDQGEEARKTLAEASKLDPRNPAVLVRSALLARRGDRAAVAGLLDAAEALYRERSNFEGVTEVLLARGTFANEGDKLEEASSFLGEAMNLARTTKSVQQQIRILFQQSNVARRRGSLGEARELAERSVQLARENDLETLALQGMFAAANIHTIKNQNQDSVSLLERALEIAGRYRDEENKARANLAVAVNYQRLLLPSKAEGAIAAAVPYYERIKHSRNLATANYILGQIEFDRAKYAAAAGRFRRVRDGAIKLEDANLQILALQSLASALREMGNLTESAELCDTVVELTRKSGRKRAEAFALIAAAEAQSELGRFPQAAAGFGAAKKLIAALDADAADAPASRLRMAVAADALRRLRPMEALKEIQGAWKSDNSPGATLERHILQCAAYTAARDFTKALETCSKARPEAESGLNRHYTLKAALLELECHAALRDGLGPAHIKRTLSGISRDDALIVVLLTQILAPEANHHEDVSQTLAEIRLKLGEEHFKSWSQRPDIRRRLRFQLEH